MSPIAARRAGLKRHRHSWEQDRDPVGASIGSTARMRARPGIQVNAHFSGRIWSNLFPRGRRGLACVSVRNVTEIGRHGDPTKVVALHRVIPCHPKIQQLMRFGHKAGPELPLHVSQRGEGDAYGSTLLLQMLLQIGDGSWQDATLSAGNIVSASRSYQCSVSPRGRLCSRVCQLGLALVAGGLVFVLITLHLWLTALTQTITGLQWLALVFKRSPKAAVLDG
jgi:hypothetical protein